MNQMNDIEYGFKDNFGYNIINDNDKWNNNFYDFYYLLSPEQLLDSKCGVCWDQVELERYLFNQYNIKSESYWICTYFGNNLPSHTFLTFENNDKYYWFEHSWFDYRGIHEYNSLKEMLKDIKCKFINNNAKDISNENTFIYKYNQPKFHISCKEFYDYIETQELIKINEPLYFYHLINKDVDISKGILSLKYMYNNKMYDIFDKYIEKYKYRITNSWNIKKYKNKTELTREEIMDCLNIFRGKYGCSYIYFFKYPPYKKLGKKMKKILKCKDIYQININDEEVMKSIKDISYGFDLSNSNNKKLNKLYYEKISEEEYFSKYDDNLEINFSTLNHISIAFNDDYCKLKFLEKIIK